MTLYTIGFTQKSAERFFERIKSHGIDILVDIRLNNRSQLAGFTKGDDLRYFLDVICHCRYQHRVEFAPTKEILDGYKKGQMDWDGYVRLYTPLMEERRSPEKFFADYGEYDAVCLLCSEPTPERCHRRLLAEMVAALHPEVTIKHI